MAASTSATRRILTWLSGQVPFLLVTLFGLYLLWPVPAGVMPLSADHTVHLTRAYLYGEQLAGGHLVGWSPTWFFGFPLGELYPVLGDLGVVALRVLGLDWPQAYALLFTLVFLTQGWVLLRCGRALGWGPIPGLVAALLVLADVGAYREGGWIYTVTYGVWPQALATSLAWLAFAELALARTSPVPSTIPPVPSDTPSAAAPPVPSHTPPVSSTSPTRHLVYAALAAAGALLAHPMALMMLALGAPLYLLTVGLRPDTPRSTARERREHLADTTLHLVLALGIGGALAAWWLLPMTAHRGWMASYGWLHASLADMLRQAAQGQWTQLMPAAVGHTASLGLLIAALLGRAPLRFFALWTAAHWLLASTDLFWGLRLDHLSSGFQHIQFQRFLTAAKPGLFLLAGAAVGGPIHLALRTWRRGHVRKSRLLARLLAVTTMSAALALAAWQLRDTRALMLRHQVGTIQTERIPGQPEFAADYAALLTWARAAWDAREHDYRMAFRADRNAHWFMDAPVTSHTPTYKLGFTPGDNFVHKPESGDAALLRRLGVRYLVGTNSAGPARATLAARFGKKLSVFELGDGEGLAHLSDPSQPAPTGTVTIEEAELAGPGHLRLRIDGVATDTTRLVLHIAGYPRWTLSYEPDDGGPEQPVEWFEAPVLGDSPIATQAQRRGGELRGGKALGDDGHEPTLIAAPARNGSYELRYQRWTRADLLGLGLSLLGLLGLLLLVRGNLLARLRPVSRRLVHPAVIALLFALGLALALLRHRSGVAREHDLASARLQRGEAIASHALAGPLKTDMLIFPAVLVRPGRSNMSEVTFPKVQLGKTLDGWLAIDDDDAKQRRRGTHNVTISARLPGADAWTPLADIPVPHHPDRRHLTDIAVPPALQDLPVDLHVQIQTTGEAPPRLGFDLVLPSP